MNVDVSSDVVIDRPPSEVSSYASDPDHVPVWYVNIKSVEWKTARSVAVGSRIAFVARPGKVLYPLGPKPDITGPDFRNVATQIVAIEARTA